ncbi:MAG: hypothetical protein M3N51_10790 [Actinomycetota bacterium]|nr:hypothetical protein [Actinomycetota bacterium]
MKVAFHSEGTVGARAARLLLGERHLEALGFLSASISPEPDRRVSRVEGLEGWALLASDTCSEGHRRVQEALDASVPLVLWTDDPRSLASARHHAEDFEKLGLTLLVGSNLRSGIGPALAAHLAGQADEVLEGTLAWTEPGRPLRRGEAVPFPEPVGPLWARPGHLPAPSDHQRLLAAPLEGPWAGAMARVSGVVEEGMVVRTLGVADDERHLQGVALAAGVLTLADGAYPPGLRWPAEASRAFLDRGLSLGLEVAAFTERQKAHPVRPQKKP